MWFVCAIIWTQHLVTLLEVPKTSTKKVKNAFSYESEKTFQPIKSLEMGFKNKKLNVGFITVLPVTSTLKP